MASTATRHTTPLLDLWFNQNYSSFLNYAVRNLPTHVPDHARQEIVNDMCIKMMTSDLYETFLQEGKQISYRMILKFAIRNYSNMLNKRAQDCAGRQEGCRTKSEVDKGTDTIITHDSGLTAVPTYGNNEESYTQSARTGYDFVDEGTPTPLETLEVEELLETIGRGMKLEWDEASDPYIVRSRVLEILMDGSSKRKDIEEACGVGPTRAKVLRSEVREVCQHRINRLEREPSVRRKKRDMTRSVRRIKTRQPEKENAVNLSSADVPQWDRLGFVFPRLRILSGVEGVAMALSQRHIQYLDQAMRILGLIDQDGALTTLGKQSLNSPKSQEETLRELVQRSNIGRLWAQRPSTAVTSESVESFLLGHTTLAPSTLARRGRTVRRWLNFCVEGQ